MVLGLQFFFTLLGLVFLRKMLAMVPLDSYQSQEHFLLRPPGADKRLGRGGEEEILLRGVTATETWAPSSSLRRFSPLPNSRSLPSTSFLSNMVNVFCVCSFFGGGGWCWCSCCFFEFRGRSGPIFFFNSGPENLIHHPNA